MPDIQSDTKPKPDPTTIMTYIGGVISSLCSCYSSYCCCCLIIIAAILYFVMG